MHLQVQKQQYVMEEVEVEITETVMEEFEEEVEEIVLEDTTVPVVVRVELCQACLLQERWGRICTCDAVSD